MKYKKQLTFGFHVIISLAFVTIPGLMLQPEEMKAGSQGRRKNENFSNFQKL